MCVFSPVAGAPADDEYNLQDHSDLYILDLGKHDFSVHVDTHKKCDQFQSICVLFFTSDCPIRI